MSYMKDLAIDEMNAERMHKFDESSIENSSWFKVGYMESSIKTAIRFLELGKIEQTLQQLKNDAEYMGVYRDRR